ncbi:MAG: hypothetical protein WEC75_06915 [Dehalococcoidia bacterium]
MTAAAHSEVILRSGSACGPHLAPLRPQIVGEHLDLGAVSGGVAPPKLPQAISQNADLNQELLALCG